ncbi:hypothetical protein CRUP_018557 [Coryphaenoides rupestris]|nr:hypothetical protein CRUP_018557 [Coryphaenoides rupestris]
MLARVSEFLWWERLWLPGNVSWSDLRDHDGRVYAKPSHLYAVLPCAFVLLFVRYLFESGSRFPTQVEVRSLCKKTSWSERRVQIWFRRRRNQARAGLRKRFCEASWRCAFYLFAFIGGILALYDSMLPSQYWYYLMEMGFYLSLLLSLTFDLYPAFFGYYFFNAMLVVLQFLHFYWAVLISKMLYKCLFSKLEGDDRSDEDEEEDSDPPKEGNPRLSYTKGSRARGRANGH